MAVALSCTAAAPARATEAVAACSFQGQVSTAPFTPLPAVGGNGPYVLTGDAECEYQAVSGAPRVDQRVTVRSRGQASSAVCGTMTMVGNPAAGETAISFSNPTIPDITQAGYEIQVSAGQGVATITEVNGAPATGAGLLEFLLRPGTASGDCVTTQAVGFDVTGSFSVHLPTQG